MSQRILMQDLFREIQCFPRSKLKFDRFAPSYDLKISRYEYEDFLNNELKNILSKMDIDVKANLSRNAGKMLSALKEAKWNEAIFKDRGAPYYALLLYKEGQITREQCTTVLDRFKILQEFKHKNTFSILDAKGELTSEAQQFLLPVLNQSNQFRKLESDVLQNFIKFIATLPKSEQVFCLTDVGSVMRFNVTKDRYKKRLEHVLEGLGALYIDRRGSNLENDAIVHLPIGVVNSLNKARFGDKHHVPVFTRLGNISMQQLETDRNNDHWPRDGAFPGTVSDAIHQKKVHSFNTTFTADLAHNDHHANVLASLPIPIRHALLKLATITRQTLQKSLAVDKDSRPKEYKKLEELTSKEIWEWIACDFRYFLTCRSNLARAAALGNSPYVTLPETIDLDVLYTEKATPEQMTQAFCKLLETGNQTDVHYTKDQPIIHFSKGGYLINMQDDNKSITPAGVVAIVNMIEDEKSWKTIGIDPNFLKNPFKEAYDTIKANFAKLYDSNPQIMIFNCQIFMALKNANLQDQFDVFLAQQKDYVSKIKFIKYTEDPTINMRKNRVYLEFNGQLISSDKWLLNIVKSQLALENKNKSFFNTDSGIKNEKPILLNYNSPSSP